MNLLIPDGAEFNALYRRDGTWGCILYCTPNFWPSAYRENFADLRPPEPRFHSCSGASAGCKTPQEAIDLAFEKMKLNMAFLDGIPRPQKPVDTAVIAGLDLGDIDL